MNILITLPQGEIFRRHFPEHILNRLREIGELSMNESDRPFSPEELRERLRTTDVLITHWGTPQITSDLLQCAPRLRMIAHGAGTVARIASEACYERGIPIVSANSVMAEYVAESVLAYMLTALHRVIPMDRAMHDGQWTRIPAQSLSGSEIGLIGLGTVGRNLLRLLAPFRCRAHVYDPYLPENALDEWPFAEKCAFEEAMSMPVVSIHAAQTPETHHMIDERALRLMPDGGLIVNTARGSLIDTQALVRELKTGRIRAVLDVFEQEGAGSVPEELAALDDSILMQPHMAASAVTWQMTQAIVDDICRLIRGEPLKQVITLGQYRLMTQE